MSEDSNLSELNQNPMFRLSLGAKELFHSNFLAFLFEQSECSDLQKALLKEFGVGNLRYDFEIETFRERNNFDLIVWVKPKEYENEDDFLNKCHLIFIENKFKSVPNKEQLDSYSEKICKAIKNLTPYEGEEIYNQESDDDNIDECIRKDYDIIKRFSRKTRYTYKCGNTVEPYDIDEKSGQIHNYLLGIHYPACFKEDGNGNYIYAPNSDSCKKYAKCPWRFTSYNVILGILGILAKKKIEDCLIKNMVKQYCKFTRSIIEELNLCFSKKNAEQKYFYRENMGELHSLRIKDLFEKYNISLLKNYLEKELNQREQIYEFEENFYRGEGILSIWKSNQKLMSNVECKNKQDLKSHWKNERNTKKPEDKSVRKMKCKGYKGIQIQGGKIKTFIQLNTFYNGDDNTIKNYCKGKAMRLYEKYWKKETTTLNSFRNQFYYTEENLTNCIHNSNITYENIKDHIIKLLPA